MPLTNMAIRNDFIGRTDPYLHPYLTGEDVMIFDTMGQYLITHFRDVARQRMSRYKRNWQFYESKMFQQQYRDGTQKFYVNLVRPFVDKTTDWLFKKPWEIIPPPGNDGLKAYLDAIWKHNNKELLSWKMGQMGGVTGDVFVMVTVNNYNPTTRQFLPPEEQTIKIKLLNSSFVHPVFDPATDKIKSCLIQYPILTQAWQARNRARLEPGRIALHTITMTETEIHEFVNDEELTELARENVFGEVPLVHIQNLPHAASFFGIADVDDIAMMNEELNVVGHSMRETVKYHAEPVTLIFGARARDLDRGASKTWSGLPKDARVENLMLYGDQTAAKQFYDILKQNMHIVGSMPEQALGEMQLIANTSQSALEMQYMPLWEKTLRKQLTYGDGIRKVNNLILRISADYFGIDLVEDLRLSDPSTIFDCKVEFASPFPRDEQLALAVTEQKLRMRVESMAGALREQRDPNPQQKAAEIIADVRGTFFEETERAAATMGQLPNLTALSQNSLAISFGLSDYYFELDDALLNSTLLVQAHRNTQQGVTEEVAKQQQQQQAQVEFDQEQQAQAEKEKLQKSKQAAKPKA